MDWVELRRPVRMGAFAALGFLAARQRYRLQAGRAVSRVEADIVARQRALRVQHEHDAQEAVERAHAEMESLLYTVSHDLKSPLLTVLGYIDLLRSDGTELPGETHHYVDRMEAGALYMQQLINDLLMLSRIGRMDTRAEDVDFTCLARQVAAELGPVHPAAVVTVGRLPVVTMSPVRARQLLTNLLDNAMTHGGRDDVTVEVRAERAVDGSARVWVADDGRGVPDRYRDRVFGVFERLDERTPGCGTGVGLAAVRKIVEHTGGTVVLADVPLGATVEVCLPAGVVRWQPAAVGVGA
ncbi:MAG: Phytochrome, two-component sensor histidine kinase [Acidimicrobiales bacterium]|nr:Phytochrome, two-component sensor histidine kinase [Acidimicrobiales bacterium]